MAKKKQDLTPEERLAAALVPKEEWPYALPDEWKWVRLGKIYDVNPKVQADDDLEASFVTMSDISPGIKSQFDFIVRKWGEIKKGHTQFANGDVAFAKISPCFENRKSMILDGLKNGIGAGTTELIVLRNPSIDNKYTFLFISSEEFIRHARNTYKGVVGQQRINLDFVKNYPMPLPPLSEQRRLVARIESLFAKLDAAREKVQSVLDSHETRKAALLHAAFTGKLTAKWRKEHQTELRESKQFPSKLKSAPSHVDALAGKWALVRLGDVITWSSGGTPSRKHPEYYSGDIPWVKTGELNNTYIYDTSEKITKDAIAQSSAKALPVNTVLLAMYGATIGKVGILGVEAATNQACACGICSEWVDHRFLFYYLQSQKSSFIRSGKGGAQPNISQTIIKQHEFPLPSLPEQQEIVRILGRLLAREQRARQAAEETLTAIDRMKQSILARAFRGEL